MHRGFAYRLEPTSAQAATLAQWVGATRFVYNLALEQRRDFWRQYRRQTGRSITWQSQSREVSDLRREVDWLAEVPRSALETALKELERAYRAFFERRASYPTMRQKDRGAGFSLQGRGVSVRRLNRRWSAVRIPKIGWVKYRDSRPLIGETRTVSVSCDAAGWRVAFGQEVEALTPTNSLPSVGVDRGVAVAASLSTGETFHVPDGLARLDRLRRKAQRVLARRKRGSRRALAQRRRIARLAGRSARVRRDWNHRNTTDIARRFGVVVLEDLSTRSMTKSASGTVEAPGRMVAQKRGLNRAILNVGWFQFETMLAYKLAASGGRLVLVDPKFTSQTCSECGVVDARSRKSQAIFACVACDHRANADHNAAINILRRSTALLDVEGAHFAPREASTWASPEPASRGMLTSFRGCSSSSEAA
jgi:putative transposase